MKTTAILTLLLAMILPLRTNAQQAGSTDVYMITCAPGNASYSIYGHTALRIVIRGTDFDMAYNWGIFDFVWASFQAK